MAVVLFSGGCDSTLVLYNLAMRISRKEKEHEYIIALSINHDQVSGNEKLKTIRQGIKEEFKKRELDNFITFIEIDIKQTGGGVSGPSGITHPLIWLPTAALYCNQYKDTLYLGYHKGDDYWMYKHEAETAVQNFLYVMEKKNVAIEYPLKEHLKANIITELKDKGLYDKCWYCESNDLTLTNPCGKCYPCVTHQTALLQIEKGFDKNNGLIGPDPVITNKNDQLTASVKELSVTVDGLNDKKEVIKSEVKGS